MPYCQTCAFPPLLICVIKTKHFLGVFCLLLELIPRVRSELFFFLKGFGKMGKYRGKNTPVSVAKAHVILSQGFDLVGG